MAQFTNDEIDRLRKMLDMVTFPDPGDGHGPGIGGNVRLIPGLGADGAEDGRIIMENPGGATRPFLTIRNGEHELDFFIGTEPPGPEVEAKVGSLFIQTGTRWGTLFHYRVASGWRSRREPF